MLFDSLGSLARVAFFALVAYGMLVLVLRLAGKRSLAKLNAFDLVVTVAFGSTLATIILNASVPLADGILALAGLALLQFLVSRGSIRWRWFARLVRSTPCRLVRDGRYLEAAMARERVTHDEIDASIRNNGFGRIEQVAAVVLETDGSLSVIAADGQGGELSALRSVRS